MTLHLTLKKEWFDMTRSGEKCEEYREIKLYWAARLLFKIPFPAGGFLWPWKDISEQDYNFSTWKSFTHGAPIFREYKHAQIRHGYSGDAPVILRSIKEIVIAEGRPEWGAEPGKKYFVIRYNA